MTWQRIALYALGLGALVAANFLDPEVRTALLTAGAGMVGLATRGPQ